MKRGIFILNLFLICILFISGCDYTEFSRTNTDCGTIFQGVCLPANEPSEGDIILGAEGDYGCTFTGPVPGSEIVVYSPVLLKNFKNDIRLSPGGSGYCHVNIDILKSLIAEGYVLGENNPDYDQNGDLLANILDIIIISPDMPEGDGSSDPDLREGGVVNMSIQSISSTSGAGNLEIYVESTENIGGFQFSLTGLYASSASGGLAIPSGFLASTGCEGECIIAFSFSGSIIPTSSMPGILLEISYSDHYGGEVCFKPGGNDNGPYNIVSSPSASELSTNWVDNCGGEGVSGCNDQNACNYDPDATLPDGSCEYAEDNFDCEGNCIADLDCAGECGGDAYEDDCETCDVYPLNDCVQDECGVWGGSGYLDECGTCDDDLSNDCEQDCAGEWEGDAVVDECGTCDSNSSNDCEQDCADEWGGSSVVDECGTCDSDSSNDGFYDHCEICDSDLSNDCEQDCADEWGGDAELDQCGVCNGDGSSCIGCRDDTACNYDSEATIDCEVKSGENGGVFETVVNFFRELFGFKFDEVNLSPGRGNCPCEYPENYPDNIYDCDGNCLEDTACDGECGGSAVLDDCGTCDNDPSNDCICAGDIVECWDGTESCDANYPCCFDDSCGGVPNCGAPYLMCTPWIEEGCGSGNCQPHLMGWYKTCTGDIYEYCNDHRCWTDGGGTCTDPDAIDCQEACTGWEQEGCGSGCGSEFNMGWYRTCEGDDDGYCATHKCLGGTDECGDGPDCSVGGPYCTEWIEEGCGSGCSEFNMGWARTCTGDEGYASEDQCNEHKCWGTCLY